MTQQEKKKAKEIIERNINNCMSQKLNSKECFKNAKIGAYEAINIFLEMDFITYREYVNYLERVKELNELTI